MIMMWHDRFVYQVVVPKSFAPKQLVAVYEGDERIVLPAWDPMVSAVDLWRKHGEVLTSLSTSRVPWPKLLWAFLYTRC